MTTKYMLRVAVGVCPRCGVNEPESGQRRCTDCAMHARTLAERQENIKRSAGVCITCGGIAIPGASRCQCCREQNAQRSREFRKAAKCRN